MIILFKERILNYILNFTLSVLAAFCFSYTIVNALYGIETSSYYVFISVLIIITLLSLMFINKISAVISLVVFLIATVTLYYLFEEKSQEIFAEIKIVYDYLPFYAFKKLKPDEVMEFYIVSFIILLISIFSYMFTLRRLSFYTFIASGILIFVVQKIIESNIEYLSFYIFIFISLVYYIRHIYLNSIKNNYYSPRQFLFLLNALPFCILMFTISFFVPHSSEPVNSEWLNDKAYIIYQNTRTKIGDFLNTGNNYFSFYSSGFDENKRELGSSIHLDDTIVLEVESDSREYLRGTAKEKYDGSSWLETLDELEPISGNNEIKTEIEEIFSINNNFLSDENLTHKEFIQRYFYNKNINIVYKNINTRCLFAPLRPHKIHLPATDFSDSVFVKGNGTIVAENKISEGFEYSVEFYRPKLNNNYFNTLLLNYNEHSNTLLPFLRKPQEDRIVLLHNLYTSLPDSIPERVYNLAYKLTKDYSTKYEKSKAIESYLVQNYPYTLSPEQRPKDMDFVDHFLFESREGYCTYYASAMVVLARCVNIPARYVEGYVMPRAPRSGNIYDVTNQQAHAWVEVYFNNIGWITFEPTSPFNSAFYESSDFTGVFDPDFLNDPEMQDYIDTLPARPSPEPTAIPTVETTPEPNLPSDDNPTPSQDEKVKINTTLITILLVLFIIISYFIVIIIRRKMRIKKYLKLSPKESIISFYKYFIQLFQYAGYHVNPGETPFMFSKKIDMHFSFSPITFSRVTDLFVLSKYSKNKLNEKDKETAFDFYNILLKEIRKPMKWYKYFIYKYLLGNI